MGRIVHRIKVEEEEFYCIINGGKRFFVLDLNGEYNLGDRILFRSNLGRVTPLSPSRYGYATVRISYLEQVEFLPVGKCIVNFVLLEKEVG